MPRQSTLCRGRARLAAAAIVFTAAVAMMFASTSPGPEELRPPRRQRAAFGIDEDLYPELPCYEPVAYRKHSFSQCGTVRGIFAGGGSPNDQETVTVRRCMDKTLPLPRSVVVASVRNASVAVYGGGDIVSQDVRRSGWEDTNLRVLLAAAQERQQWRESRLRSLGVMADRARDAARADVVVIDIGANVGALAVPLAHAGVRVLAVEAMPANQQLLHMSQCLGNLNTEQFQLVPVGLSDQPGKCQLIVSDGNSGDGNLHCGTDSVPVKHRSTGVVPLKTLDTVMASLEHLQSTVLTTDADAEAIRRSASESDTAILQRKEFIVKIDVEQHEFRALTGGASFFSDPLRRPSMVIIEIWRTTVSQQAANLLLRWGYVMLTVRSRHWVTNDDELKELFGAEWKAPQDDAVFVRPSGNGQLSGRHHLEAQTEFERLTAEVLKPVLGKTKARKAKP